MEYHLLWDDSRDDGNNRLAYFPVCHIHSRPYQGEDWQLTSLMKNRFYISNSMRSRILHYRYPDEISWYDEDENEEDICNDSANLYKNHAASRIREVGKLPVRLFAKGRRAQKESKAERNRKERLRTKVDLAVGVGKTGDTIERPKSKAQMRKDIGKKIKRRSVLRNRNKKRDRKNVRKISQQARKKQRTKE